MSLYAASHARKSSGNSRIVATTMLDNGSGSSSSGSGGGLRSSPLRTSPSAVSVASSCNSGDRKRPFLIGVAGGTASGKARLADIEEKEFHVYLQPFVSFFSLPCATRS